MLNVVEPVIIGDCTLYNADCMDILPTLGKVDAVVTDPPYGINYGGLLKGKGDGNGGSDKNGWKSHNMPEWDKIRPSKEIFDLILECSLSQIIWGGNYFTDYLPPTMQWLIWNKMQASFSMAEFEMAWGSQNRAARIFSYGRGSESGFAPKSKENSIFINTHPTQKPVALMKWCIEQLPQGCNTILDPFMGSGTTGVACAKMGRQFIGIELEPKYFDIAVKRITEAYKQPDLFVPQPEKAVQHEML